MCLHLGSCRDKLNMVCCTAKCQKWTTFTISGVFIILGILMVVLWNHIFHGILTHELSLADTHTKGYSMWKETPVPMYLEFYLFNWTNFDQVNNHSVKPQFKECGPYIYYEHHIRENVTFNNNYTVTFLNKRLWRFLPEKSVGPLEDKITTLNPIVATIGTAVKYKHYLVRRGVNFFLEEKKVKLAITKTVAEFLFDGYDDPILDLAHKLNISGFNVPYTKFGWFVERNGSAEYDGVYNMYTGVDDIEKLGILNTWNYNSTVSYLNGNCAKVDGTTGELWYPPENRSSITLFTSDLCSSVKFTRDGEYTVHGVEGHKYVGTEEVFDNGTIHPNMKCFVPEGIQQPSGVRNVSQCKFGAPALISYAHFYLADPSYRDAVNGMKPDKEKHEPFLALEPTTGMPLRVNAMFQINLFMDHIDGINLLSNVKPTLMPAFWFKQVVEISKDLANEAKLLLVLPSAVTYTGYGFIAIGALLAIIAGFITFKKGWKGSEEEQLLNH